MVSPAMKSFSSSLTGSSGISTPGLYTLWFMRTRRAGVARAGEELLSTAQVAEILGCTGIRVRQLAHRGVLPATAPLGGFERRLFFRASDVEVYRVAETLGATSAGLARAAQASAQSQRADSEVLLAIGRARVLFEHEVCNLIHEARLAGVQWSEIAPALGLSIEVVVAKFGSCEPENLYTA